MEMILKPLQMLKGSCLMRSFLRVFKLDRSGEQRHSASRDCFRVSKIGRDSFGGIGVRASSHSL